MSRAARWSPSTLTLSRNRAALAAWLGRLRDGLGERGRPGGSIPRPQECVEDPDERAIDVASLQETSDLQQGHEVAASRWLSRAVTARIAPRNRHPRNRHPCRRLQARCRRAAVSRCDRNDSKVVVELHAKTRTRTRSPQGGRCVVGVGPHRPAEPPHTRRANLEQELPCGGATLILLTVSLG